MSRDNKLVRFIFKIIQQKYQYKINQNVVGIFISIKKIG